MTQLWSRIVGNVRSENAHFEGSTSAADRSSLTPVRRVLVSLVALAVAGLVLIVFGARLGRRAFVVAALPLAATTAWVATQLRGDADGVPVTEHVRWVSGLDLAVDLKLDGLAATMSLIIGVVGVAVLLYSARYFARDAPDLGRLAGLLILFGGSMLGLVQANHLLVL